MHENFFHKLKVYYEDTDSGGIVYYANYLKFLERARTEALFSIGFSNKKIQEEFDALIIVKSCNIEYKKSAFLEDELTNGIEDFDLFSEQWYIHYDPNIDIVASTTFNGNDYPEIDGVVTVSYTHLTLPTKRIV